MPEIKLHIEGKKDILFYGSMIAEHTEGNENYQSFKKIYLTEDEPAVYLVECQFITKPVVSFGDYHMHSITPEHLVKEFDTARKAADWLIDLEGELTQTLRECRFPI